MDTLLRLRRAAESAEAPAAAVGKEAVTSAAGIGSTGGTSLDASSTTEAAKTGIHKLEAEMMEQIQKREYLSHNITEIYI